jgi:hypothetical protein
MPVFVPFMASSAHRTGAKSTLKLVASHPSEVPNRQDLNSIVEVYNEPDSLIYAPLRDAKPARLPE